jgi:hypothetical protein
MKRDLTDAELEIMTGGLTDEEAAMFNVDLDKLVGDPIEPHDLLNGQRQFRRLRKNLKTG